MGEPADRSGDSVGDVPSPARVWAVRVGVSPDDAPGILRLGEDELTFELDDDQGTLHIALASLGKVKRLRGSPILLVDSLEAERSVRFAFYFAKPPPLTPQGRDSRRKTKRKAITYLQATGGKTKETIQAWEAAIRDAAERASGGAG